MQLQAMMSSMAGPEIQSYMARATLSDHDARDHGLLDSSIGSCPLWRASKFAMHAAADEPL
jgi:hypothetical protein